MKDKSKMSKIIIDVLNDAIGNVENGANLKFAVRFEPVDLVVIVARTKAVGLKMFVFTGDEFAETIAKSLTEIFHIPASPTKTTKAALRTMSVDVTWDINSNTQSEAKAVTEKVPVAPYKPTATKGTTATAWTGKAFKQCHSGNVRILWNKELGAGIYAGGWTRNANPNPFWAVIDLTGREAVGKFGPEAKNSAGERAFASTLERIGKVHKGHQGPWVSLPIRDFDVPKWGGDDWATITSEIDSLIHNGTSVFIACDGGHGRTGLFLSIVLGTLALGGSDLIDEETAKEIINDPIAYIRDIYCDSCVETAQQERYTYRILGMNDLEDSVQDYGYSYGGYGYGWNSSNKTYSTGKKDNWLDDSNANSGVWLKDDETGIWKRIEQDAGIPIVDNEYVPDQICEICTRNFTPGQKSDDGHYICDDCREQYQINDGDHR